MSCYQLHVIIIITIDDLIFMRMNEQVTYIKFCTKDPFCHRGKRGLGIGLFIHELAQGAFD